MPRRALAGSCCDSRSNTLRNSLPAPRTGLWRSRRKHQWGFAEERGHGLLPGVQGSLGTWPTDTGESMRGDRTTRTRSGREPRPSVQLSWTCGGHEAQRGPEPLGRSSLQSVRAPPESPTKARAHNCCRTTESRHLRCPGSSFYLFSGTWPCSQESGQACVSLTFGSWGGPAAYSWGPAAGRSEGGVRCTDLGEHGGDRMGAGGAWSCSCAVFAWPPGWLSLYVCFLWSTCSSRVGSGASDGHSCPAAECSGFAPHIPCGTLEHG